VSFLQYEAGAAVLKGESTSVRNGYVKSFWINNPQLPTKYIPPVPKPVRVARINE